MLKNMKLLFLIIFWLTYGNKCKAQTAHCDFNEKEFSITGISSSSSYFYTCELSSRHVINGQIQTIEGTHRSPFYDKYVRLLHILASNKIGTFSYILCSKFKNLEVIWSESKAIKSIDQSAFRNCESLKYLEMSGSQIQEIPPGTFIFQGTLMELSLHKNKIKILHSESFDRLENVKTLSLQSNEISDLPENVFDPLKNLLTLNLNDNKLTVIHADSFGAHNNFDSVFLQKNQINSIDPEFIDKIKIDKLEIQRNICTSSIYYGTFRRASKEVLKNCFDNYNPRHSKRRQSTSKPSLVNFVSLDILPPKLPSSSNQNNQPIPQIQLNTFLPPKAPVESNPNLSPNQNPNVVFNTSKPPTSSCGKPITGHGDIIGGKKTIRGNFPWIAALVYSDSGKFFCGGSLVTNLKILTAAHCIQEKHSSKPTLAREFLVLLGVYDLDKPFEAGRTSYAVQSVNLHPDWNVHTEAFDADIAVLVLDQEVYFNNYIQPICVTFPNTNIAAVTKAVVVGYGKSEDGTKVHENIPKILDTPIHTHQECFAHNDVLKRISSGRTICGGTGNGVGVCHGDSGSGLYVTDGNYYSLRGIVSSSVIGGKYGCDVDTYAVFTDIIKFNDWINGVKISRFV